MNRRSFLQLGLSSALFAGVGLPLLNRTAKAQGVTKAKACILLYMEGGPSQLDTFDPKQGHKNAGDVKAISTSVSGIQISEYLPMLATRMKQLALIRSVTSKEGNHQRARHLMHTGYPPQGGVDHPALGSILAQSRGEMSLPGYVSINGPGEDAGFLSASLSPFPVLDPSKPVRYLSRAENIAEPRFDKRFSLKQQLDKNFDSTHSSLYVDGQNSVSEDAVALMKSADAKAFMLDSEPAAVKTAYGESKFGLGCLMARRLVEVGVPFIEVTLGGWDTHKDNFTKLKTDLCPTLDQGMSALLDDLSTRGLLSETLVIWCGDFGRTPRINENGGRDHFPACSTIAMAGAGVKGGQVIGKTSDDGMEVKDRPISVPDVFRTVATRLGLDADESRYAPSGRPIKTVNGGTLIPDLF
jgi:uncharacterized protein (DUF1501 family)